MTVAELSPMQLYGIIMAALATWWVLRYMLIALGEMSSWREKAFVYLALMMVFGIPVVVGFMAMR